MKDKKGQREVLKSILAMGVSTFVSLQPVKEARACHRTGHLRIRRQEHADDARFAAPDCWSSCVSITDGLISRDGDTAEFVRGLVDRIRRVRWSTCTALRTRRAGTICALTLGMLEGLSADEALQRTQTHDTRQRNEGFRSPAGDAQVAQVRRLLKAAQQDPAIKPLQQPDRR